MKFVWVPATKRYRRTEGEVKKEKLAYEVVEIETDKDSLIDRFNGYEQRIEELQAQLAGMPDGSGAAEEGSTPSPPQPIEGAPASRPNGQLPDENEAKRRMVAMLQNMRVDEIEDKILESKGAPFGRYLTAAITRLGELGQEGWQHFQGFRNFCGDADGPAVGPKGKIVRVAGSEERGLRYLALAMIADLEKQQLPPASRPLVVHHDADSNAGAEAA